jgi:hypothetical protein
MDLFDARFELNVVVIRSSHSVYKKDVFSVIAAQRVVLATKVNAFRKKGINRQRLCVSLPRVLAEKPVGSGFYYI